MAPGYIAVGLAIREMRAARPGDHKYQLDHHVQRHFSLNQWCVATRLSFLKDTHRTCGVVMGIGFLIRKYFCVMIERNLEVKTGLWFIKNCNWGNTHELVSSLVYYNSGIWQPAFRTYFKWKAVGAILFCFVWIHPPLVGWLFQSPDLSREMEKEMHSFYWAGCQAEVIEGSFPMVYFIN